MHDTAQHITLILPCVYLFPCDTMASIKYADGGIDIIPDSVDITSLDDIDSATVLNAGYKDKQEIIERLLLQYPYDIISAPLTVVSGVVIESAFPLLKVGLNK